MIERPSDGDTTRAGGSGVWETWAPSAPASRIRAVLGVEPGERVVVRGLETLTDQQRVLVSGT